MFEASNDATDGPPIEIEHTHARGEGARKDDEIAGMSRRWCHFSGFQQMEGSMHRSVPD